MKHIKTLSTTTLKETMKKGGCGECQTSCQSACKTSCTVGNQSCENKQYHVAAGNSADRSSTLHIVAMVYYYNRVNAMTSIH